MAPWADALFAMDAKWWEKHLKEVRLTFTGALYSNNDFSKSGIIVAPVKGFGNSGAGAIAMAAKAGAKRVIMLGYDCQHTGG